MTFPVRIVTPNAATEELDAQQVQQVRNAMPALRTAASVFQIMERKGSNAVPRPAEDFPLPCTEHDAHRRLNMLKNSYKASGYQVRDSDIRAEHETMNTGFVVTYLGRFEAAYEIVEVGE